MEQTYKHTKKAIRQRMKLTVILLSISLMLNCQGRIASNKSNNTNTQEDTIMIDREKVEIEYYDFQTTQNGTQSLAYERGDGWLVEINAMKNASSGSSGEYAPAIDFYELQKSFYLNGMIKGRGKYMSNVAFGKHEDFDENGNCIKIVDEDKKFGDIKREDIIQLLEKEGWFNRRTGENIITEDSILPTNYTFYRNIERYMSISFKRAVVDNQGKETESPKWFIEIDPRNRGKVTNYIIDGNTGQFEKKEIFISGIE